jgi:hypothetical protein
MPLEIAELVPSETRKLAPRLLRLCLATATNLGIASSLLLLAITREGVIASLLHPSLRAFFTRHCEPSSPVIASEAWQSRWGEGLRSLFRVKRGISCSSLLRLCLATATNLGIASSLLLLAMTEGGCHCGELKPRAQRRDQGVAIPAGHGIAKVSRPKL